MLPLVLGGIGGGTFFSIGSTSATLRGFIPILRLPKPLIHRAIIQDICPWMDRKVTAVRNTDCLDGVITDSFADTFDENFVVNIGKQLT